MIFRDATDRFVKAGGTMAAVAEAFGVSRNTVSRWRRVSTSSARNTFNPPPDWPATLTRLAKREAHRAADNSVRFQQLVTALTADSLDSSP